MQLAAIQLSAPQPKPVDAPPAAAPAVGPPMVSAEDPPVTSPMVAEEAPVSLGAKLLGGMGEKQNSYLANQQLLGAVTAELGARISHVASNVWAMLRGTESPTEATESAPSS